MRSGVVIGGTAMQKVCMYETAEFEYWGGVF